MNIQVIDLGIGNIRSLTSALGFLGVGAVVTSDPATLGAATHVILPGVGAFDAAMESMIRLEFVGPLRTHVLERGAPIIGVCLGMQLLLEGSDEGQIPGLGLVAGRCAKLIADPARHRKVPHVGFASVYGQRDDGLFADIATPSEFYFTHSFAMHEANDLRVNVAWSNHSRPFIAGFQRENVCGVQFHPEKSQSTGLRLLGKFLERT